eukprot:c18681_g1_i1 orf=131-526(+)
MDAALKLFLLAEDTVLPIEAVAPTIVHGQVDWMETAEAHIFKVNVPGFKKESIQVQVLEEDILQIAGEQKMETIEGKQHCLERPRGSFFRQFKLPDKVVADNIRAYDEHGVLIIVVPKKPFVKKIHILPKV